MKTAHHAWLYALCLTLTLPLGCKDQSPCDEGQDSIGTGCFPEAPPATGGTDGAAGAPTSTDAGAGGSGSDIEPPGNPDAMFGTTCASNAECGGPAPICATDPLFFCSQIDCEEGEANEGVCPEGWRCFKYQDNPSICVNF